MSRTGFVVSRREKGRGAVVPPAVVLPIDQASQTPLIPSSLKEALPAYVQDAVMEGYRLDEKAGLLEEIRLRANRRASLTVGGMNRMIDLILTSSELFSILTRMCEGSLYAYSQNINDGFVTLTGGIRVGVVGEATCEGGQVVGVREISALCIRIPHRHGSPGEEISRLLRHMMAEGGSPKGILIYAPPGVGKTTLLRGVTAHLAGGHTPLRTVVVDTRGELTFPLGSEALCLDVLTGYPRALGVSIATRSMGAQVVICDEIGERQEALALVSAYHGGVPLVATAHGKNVNELLRRPGLQLLHRAGIFGAYVGIRRNGQGGFIYDTIRAEEVDHAL